VIHPWLFPLLPLLLLLANNAGEASLWDSLRIAIVMELCVTVVYLGAVRLLGSRHAAATFCTFAVGLLFTYQGIERLLVAVLPFWMGGWVFWMSLATQCAVLVGLALLMRGDTVSSDLSDVLNTVVGGLFALNVGRWLWTGFMAASPGVAGPGQTPAAPPVVQLQLPDKPPDIYVILLDGYARQDVLDDVYGFDNSEFVSGLQALDFKVLSKARANYPVTRLAVPAVMRGSYLDDVAARIGPESMAIRPLIDATDNGAMLKALRDGGYDVVQIGSEVLYTRIPSDRSWAESAGMLEPTEYEWIVLQMTALPELFIRLNLPWSRTAIHRRRVEHDLASLQAEAKLRGPPKLVFAHIFTPHPPFVFGPEGEVRNSDMEFYQPYGVDRQRTLMGEYSDQLQYVNGPILQAVGNIIKDSEREPIVAVFGDHGLRLFLSQTLDETCLRESFSILHALHLPQDVELPQTLSPVNIFRVIFDSQFGTELGLLPDRSFYTDRDHLYDQTEVTDQVDGCSVELPAP